MSLKKKSKIAFLKPTKLGLFLIYNGTLFQRRVVDTEKDLPPSDSDSESGADKV